MNGNMLWNTGLGGYTYPATSAPRPHAPVTAGPRAYSYDANGNALTNGTQSYAWDGENRMLSAGSVSFVYGPDGARLKKNGSSGTTLYLGADIEQTPAGAWVRYPHPDTVTIGSGGVAVTTWLTRDHSQSIWLRTDAAGALTQASRYEPYGAELASPPQTTRRPGRPPPPGAPSQSA